MSIIFNHRTGLIETTGASGLSIKDSTGADSAAFSHDGTDFATAFTNTADWNITGLSSEMRLRGGASMTVEDGGSFSIFDSGNTDAIVMSHNGTDFSIAATNTADIDITGFTRDIRAGDGTPNLLTNGPWTGASDQGIRLTTATNDDNIEIGLEVAEGVNNRRARFFMSDETGEFGLQGSASSGVPDFSLYLGGTREMYMPSGGNLYLLENAAAGTDNAGYGQIWIRNDVANTLMFTDDAGTDFVIAGSTAGSSISGTVANDQVVVGTGTNTVDSSSSLTFDGTTLVVGADVRVSNGSLSVNSSAPNTGLNEQISFMDVNGGVGRFGSYNWNAAAWQPASFSGSTVSINAEGDGSFELNGANNAEFVGLGGYLWLRDGMNLRVGDTGDTDWVEFAHDGTNFLVTPTNTTDWRFQGLDVRLRTGAELFINADNDAATSYRIQPGAGVGDDATIITSGGQQHQLGGGEVFAVLESTTNKFQIDHTNDRVWIRDGYVLRMSDSTDTDYIQISHNGTDANMTGTNTTNFNVSGMGFNLEDGLLLDDNLVSVMNDSGANADRGPIHPLIGSLMAMGRKVLGNSEFAGTDANGIVAYDNASTGEVSVTQGAASSLDAGVAAPNSTGNIVEVSWTGTGDPTPNDGGFRLGINTEENHSYLWVFLAKVPSGVTLNPAQNTTGNNSWRYWLTDSVGTGKYEYYAYLWNAGDGGTFSSAGFMGVDNSGSAWDVQIAYSEYYDITESPHSVLMPDAGGTLRIMNSSRTDYADFSHDGTDLNTTFTNTAEWNISGLTGDITLANALGITFLTNAGGDDATRIYRASGDALRLEYEGNVHVVNAVTADNVSWRAADTEKMVLDHTTNDVLDLRDGYGLRIRDSSDADYIQIAHNGTDANITTVNTTEVNIAEDGTLVKLPSASDVSLVSTDHPFQIGESNTANLRMDNNEIIAASNGVAGTLNLQTTGGNIDIGAQNAALMRFLGGSDLHLLDNGIFRVYDSTDADYIQINESGSNSQISTNTNPIQISSGADSIQFTGGATVRVYDSGNTDYAEWSHNGTDFTTNYNATTWHRFTGIGSGWLFQDGGDLRVYSAADTEYISLTHNGTNAVIDTNAGVIAMNDTVTAPTIQSPGQIQAEDGFHGNYDDTGTNTWGGPIWGMDDGFTGPTGGANALATSTYGMRWNRSGSSQANAEIGEGVYVYQNGVLEGGIGTAGVYSAGNVYVTGSIEINSGSRLLSTPTLRGTVNAGGTADNSGVGSYNGYSINNDLMFMHNGTAGGIYDEVQNQWKIRTDTNSINTVVYGNGAARITAGATTTIAGDLDMSAGTIIMDSDEEIDWPIMQIDPTPNDGSIQMKGTSAGNDFFILMNNSASYEGLVVRNLGAVELYNADVLEFQTQDSNAAGQTSGAEVKAHNQTLRDVGFNLLPIFNEDVSDTLEASHCGHVYFKDGTANITLTLDTGTDFPEFGVVTIINGNSTGNITIARSTATLYYLDGSSRSAGTSNRTVGPGGVATLWRENLASDIYYIWGSGIT